MTDPNFNPPQGQPPQQNQPPQQSLPPQQASGDNNLLVGTRPAVGNRVIMTSADGFDGYEIMDYKGMAWGISVRAKDVGQDCAMGCKQITGGELSSYSQLGNESRQRAVDQMLKMAYNLGANGVINVEFTLGGAAQGASEVIVYGTAVLIKPIVNYVPEGAIGNILSDISRNTSK